MEHLVSKKRKNEERDCEEYTDVSLDDYTFDQLLHFRKQVNDEIDSRKKYFVFRAESLTGISFVLFMETEFTGSEEMARTHPFFSLFFNLKNYGEIQVGVGFSKVLEIISNGRHCADTNGFPFSVARVNYGKIISLENVIKDLEILVRKSNFPMFTELCDMFEHVVSLSELYEEQITEELIISLFK